MSTSGILLINKPAGISSNCVLRKIQKNFSIQKIGHGGTLDPFATGLLVVLVGEATKVARFLLGGDKAYEATASIGRETSTGDTEGEATGAVFSAPSLAEWEKTRPAFLGAQKQVPPLFSAVKVRGRPLYKYARQKQAVAIESKKIRIHALNILKYTESRLRFYVECSGGTYIRALAQDWAKASQTRAHLTSLCRLKSSTLSIEDAYGLEGLLRRKELPPLLPIHRALPHIKQLYCPSQMAKKVTFGNAGALRDFLTHQKLASNYLFLLHEKKEEVVALLKKCASTGDYRIERVFF